MIMIIIIIITIIIIYNNYKTFTYRGILWVLQGLALAREAVCVQHLQDKNT